MSKRQIGLLVLMVTLMLATSCQQAAPNGQFAFQTQSVTFELGYDEASRLVSFPFANKSDTPIEVVNIVAKCGCTLVKADKRVYEPGETGAIDVEFKPYSLFGTVSKGVLVTIRGTDDEERVVELKINAEVPFAYKPSATRLKWKASTIGNEQKVIIEKSKQHPIQITGLVYDRKIFDVQLTQDDAAAQLTIRQIGVPASNQRLQYIEVHTDNPLDRYKRFNIKCGFSELAGSAPITEMYKLSEDSLVWQNGDREAQKVTFYSGNESLTVEKVAMLNGDFDVSVEPRGDGKRFEIQARPRYESVKNIEVAVMQIYTDAEEIKNKVINYNLIVMP